MTYDAYDLPRDAENAVRATASSMLEEAFFDFDPKTTTFGELCEAVYDRQLDDTLATDLDLEERLTVVESCADYYDFDLSDVTVDNLRLRIEALAACSSHCERHGGYLHLKNRWLRSLSLAS